MNEIQLKALNTEIDIYDSLKSCADSLFNQRINNDETLMELSKKYAKYGRCYVVTIDDVTAGFVASYINDMVSLRAFLSILVVSNQYHGLGLGSLLLDVVLTSCKIFRMKELFLEVDANNEIAISLYEKRGFIIKDKTKPNSIIMCKNI